MEVLDKINTIDQIIRKLKKATILEVAKMANAPATSVRQYLLIMQEEGEPVELINGENEFILHKRKKNRLFSSLKKLLYQ